MAKKNKHNRRSFNSSKPRYNKNKRNRNKNSKPFKSSTNTPSKKQLYILDNMREVDIGVTEFASQAEGFDAAIQTRFSDFHINEIDLDGKVIKLTDRQIPSQLKFADAGKRKEALETKLTKENGVSNKNMDELRKLFATGEVQSAVEINVTNLTKDQQDDIPKIIKQLFQGVLQIKQISNAEGHFIKCVKTKKIPKDDNWLWPGEFTYFVLHKENINTSKAIAMLSSYVRCYQSQIMCSNQKDRRSKSSQLCCIYRRDPTAIKNAAMRVPMLQVGNFEFKSDPLDLGHPKANRYQIVLRDVTVSDELIKNALDKLDSIGFINYYDMQRFGDLGKLRTYDIGKTLLKSEWKSACELIMKPREHESLNMKRIREYWWETRDAVGALKMFKRRSRADEAKILDALVLFGKTDYFAAISGIASATRRLYINAYQSLVWNKIVSRRIKEWGAELREGDLVFLDRSKINLDRYGKNTVLTDADVQDDDSEETKDEPEERKDDNEDDTKAESDSENHSEEPSKYKALAKPLTKQDIKSGKYTIHDLVLPLPGYDILYPSNDTKKWYAELLAEDGLTFDSFNHDVKLYKLPGDYRPVFAKPELFEWRVVQYKSRTETLILSDLELLTGKTLEEVNKSEDNIEENPQPRKGIILQFDLHSSCYPQMLLREILKIDTSIGNRMKITMEAHGLKREHNETGDEKTDAEEAKKLKSE